MSRKNLVILHLESISWQTVHAFPEAFPHLSRLMAESRLYRRYFSSATSTQMVLAYLAHGNDYELDAASGLARPAANNPSLFSFLKEAGYQTDFLCASAMRTKQMLPLLSDSLPPVWTTDDFGVLLRQFESCTSSGPFAAYVWNLVTHIEHATALREHVRSLDELVGGACAVADHVLGLLLESLERRGLKDNTALIVFGDHGDDFWSHGFRGGQLHGTEPYASIVHAPLLIRDPSLGPGPDHQLASTIDILPTCLDLLGMPTALAFAPSGRSLLQKGDRVSVFSQNFTASQPDAPATGVRRAFSAHDRSHTLLVSARGLEFFNHRLDPTNHCNLLRFFDMGADGGLAAKSLNGQSHPHFGAAGHYVLGEAQATLQAFKTLRNALRVHIQRKEDFVTRQTNRDPRLDLLAFDRIADDSALTSDRPAQSPVAWLKALFNGASRDGAS